MAHVVTRALRLAVVNAITFSRLLAGLSSVALVGAPASVTWLAAVFVYILVSDLLDGALARRWRVTTSAGAIFDYVVDRFNIYLQICVLLSAGVPVLVFVPFLVRDLIYVFAQTYVRLDRVAGTKELSLISTIGTYLYVMVRSAGFSGSALLNAFLALTYVLSLVNLGWRVSRLRNEILEKLRREFAVDCQ
ncbi:MAG TPA: CDP-alcohol phosphatidyltransferase family protein [Acidobacteriaceae bacterium]|nr:CDP-alcohol phosphatidyltransferase family protein [Acidobacteriaceae bacterium]